MRAALPGLAPLAALLAAGACGGAEDLPDQATVEAAKAEIEADLAALEQARWALELLGILPSYECTAARSEFVAAASAEIPTEIGCAAVSTAVVDGTTDQLTIAFGDPGCAAVGHQVSGTLVVSVTGGTDSFALELDARQLVVDGIAVQALAGYGTCGDETSYWVAADGTVPGVAGTTFAIDASVAKRDGIPVIGGTTLILDGTGALTTGARTVTVTATGLAYQTGDLLPEAGRLVIQTPEHRIQVTFDLDSPIYGEVEVVIDAHDAVTIPVVG
jgi:hypothetical protein